MPNFFLFLSFLFLSFRGLLHASELELGMGAGVMFYPDYVGSKNNNILAIPYPYLSYQSENLNIDKDGLEQKLFSGSNLSLQLSASGSLPVNSSGAREGMSDLDPAVEFGPALVYNLYSTQALNLTLNLPLRAVFSSDFKSVDYRGYIYELRAELDYLYHGYLLQLHTGGVWADGRYNNYLYGVKSNEVTNTRFAYEANAGYVGYKTSMGISKKFNNIWTGAFVRHYNLSHTSFENSPLKETNSAMYGGVFVAYLFDEETTRSIKNWIE